MSNKSDYTPNYNSTNIFAKILRKEIEVKVVYEDEFSLAFWDVSKAAPIHVLVIPKGEFIDFSDFINKASQLEIACFFKAVDEVVDLVEARKGGFRLISNAGADAHQTVLHFHVHILAGKPLGPLLSSDEKLR